MTEAVKQPDRLETDFLHWRVDLLQNRQEMDDSTLWQAPGLALAAQAFLLTIALADQGTRFNRTTAAVLALCTAGAAIYLLGRRVSGPTCSGRG